MATSILGQGTTFTVNSQAIGGVESYSITGGTASDIKTTSMADAAHTYKIGLPERGEVSLTMIADPDNVGQAELFSQNKAQTVSTMVITHPSATLNVFTFSVLIKGITWEAGVDNVVRSTAVGKITGEIVQT